MRVSSLTPVNEVAAGLFLFGFLSMLSNDGEVARSLNALIRESRALFGNCDSHALTESVIEYFCGDDPIDSDSK